jgi:hypothetical protein
LIQVSGVGLVQVKIGRFGGVPIPSICFSKSAAAATNAKQSLKMTQVEPSISKFWNLDKELEKLSINSQHEQYLLSVVFRESAQGS